MRILTLRLGVFLSAFLTVGPATAQEKKALAELDAAFLKAKALHQAGKAAEAIPFLSRALALAPEAFGPDHINTAGIANTLGVSCMATGQFGEAAKAFRVCLEIREKRLGPRHEQVAEALSNLAVAYLRLGRYKDAEAHSTRALAIREGQLPANHPDLALSLNNLAVLYEEMGLYDKATALFERSLRIQEAAGKDHAGVAYVANNLASLYGNMGRFQEAEALARRSLRIREAANDVPEVANCLDTLARLLSDMGRHKEAESLYGRCLEIRETRLGKNHYSVAGVLKGLGSLFYVTGRFREAEDAYRRCVEVNEAAFGKDHPQTAAALGNLASLYADLGRDDEVERLLRRSLEITEAKLGKDHPALAANLNTLAALYAARGRLQEAEPLYRRCLAIAENAYGKDHPQVATFLGNLGSVCQRTDRLREAETYIGRSLQIYEAHFGKNHPRVAAPLNNLGILYWRMGRSDKAAAAFQRCVDLERDDQNSSVAVVALSNLAAINQALGRKQQAWQLEERALEIHHAGLRRVFAFSSEAAMHGYLQNLAGVLPSVLAMATSADDPGKTAASAYTWILRLKAVALDTLCRYRQLQHALGPDDPLTARVGKYQSLKQQLANASLNPPAGLAPGQLAKKMTQWRQEAEELEAELSRTFSAKQALADVPTVAAVQNRLGRGAALVEFVRAPLRDFKKVGHWLEEHYFAFILGPGPSAVKLIDLGAAKDIDVGVESLRNEFTDFQEKLKDCETAEEVRALEKAQEKQFKKASAGLYRRLFAPLRQALRSAELIYLAPDGALNRLPFEALVDENNKYLVESYRCAYLSSGRDLLRPATAKAKGTVVFAGPDYKLGAEERLARAQKLLAPKEVLALRGAPAGELRSAGWKALPGAAAEAKDIRAMLQGTSYGPVQAYVGPEALEEVLKAMPAPRVLHLATHGFFLDHEPQAPAAEEDGAGAGWARGRLKQMDNPLLRSGIVLAGANTIGDKEAAGRVEDGWVTAEEIALLNLRGTELVVLSACQTGLGDVKSGEGVFGLRRAFLFAGARTLVTSLFEVPDKDTRDLMGLFYRGLKSGQGKLAALHAAQRELLQKRRQAGGAAHPFFWASFVMVGDPD
jgi:CHAT domain-containing protein/Flp pilus assembly protein TadD